MTDGFSVDVQQLQAHVARIDAIQARFGAIQAASAAIAQDDRAYGILCAWLPPILERRHKSQDQLIAYVRENLELAADALVSTGRDYDDADATAAERMRQAGRS